MTRVLIVEDSATQAEEIRQLVESAGYTAATAPDGESGLALLRQERLDAVLTDVIMPGMSGFDLCRALKADPALKDIPVIILTSLAEPLHMIEALEAGAENYITKPFHPEYLLSRLHTILLHRRQRDATRFGVEVEVMFLGRRFSINSDRQQILGMLVSALEDVFRTNQELVKAKEELDRANTQVRAYARQLEGVLRFSEEKYRVLMHEASDAIFLIGGDDRILEANAQAEALLGVEASHIVGRNFLEFVAPQHRDRAASTVRGLSQEKRISHEESQIVRSDGSVRWIEASSTRVEMGDQSVLMGIQRDITERKEQEQRLRESEERYRNLVEDSVQGLIIVQDHRIAFCNRAGARMFGYETTADLLGSVAGRMVHPEDLERVSAHRKALLRGESVAPTIEYRGVRKDGSIVWIESYRHLIVWEGRPAMQSLTIDVTAQRNLEQQLQVAQRMEVVGRLAGGIAHDFNNILAIISSYTDFVLDGLGEKDAAREDATVVKDATLRAAALTRQLLAFSRRQTMQLRTLDLNATVRNLEKMLRRLIGEDIALHIRLDKDLGPIRADESQIEQVLMNLVVNSRDAMPIGGDLSIETSNQALDENYAKMHTDVKPGNYVMLAVEDTGCGMDEQTRQRIFDPFFTTKEQGKGTGLGLATVYGIVKQMEGAIFVYSELNKGTTFKVYFPMTIEPRAAARKQAVPTVPHPAAGTILVVEDDAGVRSAAVRILKREGYTVVEAANGADGIAAVQNHAGAIDLVLSDVVMPGMSGRELWEGLQGIRTLPVLFMSGYTDDSVVNHGILEGDFPFLNKPFTKESLLAKVREVLASEPKTS
ncbi:MAG: response regulator [Candidatus Lambdaproteobacteria bacterium]|nr:response regulator [Candidatus Lambdaproteobacteria bacterium]